MRGFELDAGAGRAPRRRRTARPQRAGAERPRARGGRTLARRRCSPCSTASRSAASTCPEALGGVGAGCSPRWWCSRRWPPPTPAGSPAADRPGLAAGAVVACPDRGARRRGRGGLPRRLGALRASRSSTPSAARRGSSGRPAGRRCAGCGPWRATRCACSRSTAAPSPVRRWPSRRRGRRRRRWPTTVRAGRWELSPWTALAVRGPRPAVGGGGRRRRGPGGARRDDRVHDRARRVRQAGRPPPGQRVRPRPRRRPRARRPARGPRRRRRRSTASEPDAGVLGDAGVAGDVGGRATSRPTSASSCSAATASSSTTSPRSASARRACWRCSPAPATPPSSTSPRSCSTSTTRSPGGPA